MHFFSKDPNPNSLSMCTYMIVQVNRILVLEKSDLGLKNVIIIL